MKWKTWFPLNLAIVRICRVFKDKTVAADISALMLEIGAKLDNSVSLVQRSCDESELNIYQAAVGEIMGRS